MSDYLPLKFAFRRWLSDCSFTSREERSYVWAKIRKSLIRVPQDIQNLFSDNCILKTCTLKYFSKLPFYHVFIKNKTKNDRFKARFWQLYRCFKTENTSICPVDGAWSVWTKWNHCSTTCGLGVRQRVRRCNNPTPWYYGFRCVGRAKLHSSCIKECESSPGKDIIEARQNIAKIHAKHSGLNKICMKRHCTFKEVSKYLTKRRRAEYYWTLLHCLKYHQACPVDGGWAEWSSWSSCSAECTMGFIHRLRTCTHPKPRYWGKECTGKLFQTQTCLLVSDFCETLGLAGVDILAGFTPCSVSCGAYGVRTSRRRCSDRFHCGRSVNRITRSCYLGPCPSKGGWGSWTEYTQCSALCGQGRQTRLRRCTKPPPQGGKFCQGKQVKTRRCSSQSDCKPQSERKYINGFQITGPMKFLKKNPVVPVGDTYNMEFKKELEPLYDSWSPWSECSKLCGGGLRVRKRTCVKMNIPCKGEVSQIQFCNTFPCPVNGGWSDWQPWSACSVTCSRGIKLRFRTCSNPFPKHGGICFGSDYIKKPCLVRRCRDKGQFYWRQWAEWSKCTVSCGAGIQVRLRECANLLTQEIAFKCEGLRRVSRTCYHGFCPVNGGWASWGQWSECTASCGIGWRFRDRTCTDPTPLYDGNLCAGPHTKRTRCYNAPCDGNGNRIIIMSPKSYLVYAPRVKPRHFLHVLVHFKPVKDDSVLIHRHLANCTRRNCSHEVIVGVSKGRPYASVHSSGIDLNLKSSSVIKKNTWHSVLLTVVGQNGSLRVDDKLKARSIYKEPLKKRVNYAAVMFVGRKNPKIQTRTAINFIGNISLLRLNFREIDLFSQVGWRGFGTPLESKFVVKSRTKDAGVYVRFRGFSYVTYPVPPSKNFQLKVIMNFFPNSRDGLLLFIAGKVAGSYILVTLRHGALFICLNMAPKSARICRKSFIVKVHRWYHLSVEIMGNQAIVSLDLNTKIQISAIGPSFKAGKEAFIGGGPTENWPIYRLVMKKISGFRGYVHSLELNKHKYAVRDSPLVINNTRISSRGFSLAGRLTELVIHGQKKDAVLKCDYTPFVKSGSAKIYWIRNGRYISNNEKYKITKQPGMKKVSVLTVHPKPGRDFSALFACQMYYNKDYSIPHAFVVLNPPPKPKIPKMSLGAVERALIVLLVLFILALVILGVVKLVQKHLANKRDEKERLGPEGDVLILDNDITESDVDEIIGASKEGRLNVVDNANRSALDNDSGTGTSDGYDQATEDGTSSSEYS